MDPSSPLQLIAWAVAAVLALLTAGCVHTNGYQPAYGYNSVYVPPVAPSWAPPPLPPRTVTCFPTGGLVTCL